MGNVPQSTKIIDGGQGYTTAKGVSVSGPGGMKVDIIADDITGEIISAKIREAGSGYTNGLRVQVIQSGGEYGQLEVVVPNACFISKNPGAWGNGIGIAVIDHGADYQLTYNSRSGHVISDVFEAGKIITNEESEEYTGDQLKDLINLFSPPDNNLVSMSTLKLTLQTQLLDLLSP